MKDRKEVDSTRVLIWLLYFLIAFSLIFSLLLYVPPIRRAPVPPSFEEFYGSATCASGTPINGLNISVILSNGTASRTTSSQIQNGAYSLIVNNDIDGTTLQFFIETTQVGADTYVAFAQINKNFVQQSGQPGCPSSPPSDGGTGGSGGGVGSSGGGGGGGGTPTLKTTNISYIFSKGNVIVTWKTDIDSDSQVDYGVSKLLGLTRSVALMTKDHAIELDNLLPNTLYYYGVSSKASAGVRVYSQNFTFVTPQKKPDCSDEIDNDFDGLVDLSDPGCADASDTSEVEVQTPAAFQVFTAKNAILKIALLSVLTLIVLILGFVTYSSWAIFKKGKK